MTEQNAAEDTADKSALSTLLTDLNELELKLMEGLLTHLSEFKITPQEALAEAERAAALMPEELKLTFDKQRARLEQGGEPEAACGLYWVLKVMSSEESEMTIGSADLLLPSLLSPTLFYYFDSSLAYMKQQGLDQTLASPEVPGEAQYTAQLFDSIARRRVRFDLKLTLKAWLYEKNAQCAQLYQELTGRDFERGTYDAVKEAVSCFSLPAEIMGTLFIFAQSSGTLQLLNLLNEVIPDLLHDGERGEQILKGRRQLSSTDLNHYLLRCAANALTGTDEDFKPWEPFDNKYYRDPFADPRLVLLRAALICAEYHSCLRGVLPGVPAHTAFLMGLSFLFDPSEGLGRFIAGSWLFYAALCGHPVGYLAYSVYCAGLTQRPRQSDGPLDFITFRAFALYLLNAKASPLTFVPFAYRYVKDGTERSVGMMLFYNALAASLEQAKYEEGGPSTAQSPDLKERAFKKPLFALLDAQALDEMMPKILQECSEADAAQGAGLIAAALLGGKFRPLMLRLSQLWTKRHLSTLAPEARERLEQEYRAPVDKKLQLFVPYVLPEVKDLLRLGARYNELYALQGLTGCAQLDAAAGLSCPYLNDLVLRLKAEAKKGELWALQRLYDLLPAGGPLTDAEFKQLMAESFQRAPYLAGSFNLLRLYASELEPETLQQLARWNFYSGHARAALKLSELIGADDPKAAAFLQALAGWQQGLEAPLSAGGIAALPEFVKPIAALFTCQQDKPDFAAALTLSALYYYGVLFPRDWFLSEKWLRRAISSPQAIPQAEHLLSGNLFGTSRRAGASPDGALLDLCQSFALDAALPQSVMQPRRTLELFLTGALVKFLSEIAPKLGQTHSEYEAYAAALLAEAAVKFGAAERVTEESTGPQAVLRLNDGSRIILNHPLFALREASLLQEGRLDVVHEAGLFAYAETICRRLQGWCELTDKLPALTYCRALYLLRPYVLPPQVKHAAALFKAAAVSGIPAAAAWGALDLSALTPEAWGLTALKGQAPDQEGPSSEAGPAPSDGADYITTQLVQ